MIDRILILRLSALGDIIHTLPAVEMLRNGYPDARMAWVVEQPYAELVRISSEADDVIAVSTRRWRRAPLSGQTRKEIAAAIRDLRRVGEGGLAIDFQGLAKSAVLGRLARASDRITFPSGVVRERLARVLATRAATGIDSRDHIVDQNRALARAAGGEGEGGFAGLQRFAAGGSSSRVSGTGRIVLNPGAGRVDKLWGVESFAALGRRLTEMTGGTPLIVWGPGERSMAEEIVREGGGELSPPTTLQQLAALLRDAALVIAADTGPLHLAAALDTPVVGLFGPTDARRNGPWCQLERCISGRGSMDDISVDEVAVMVEAVLAGRREANRSE